MTAVALLLLPCLTVAADYSAWGYWMPCTLHTKRAGVTTTQYNFPVLIRSTLGNTAANGADIRFSNADGTTALSYELERWVDNGNNDTVIAWVKVDTVKGNDSGTIRIYWGDSSATTASSPNNVFSTSNGFLGVYHLSEDGGTTADNYKDATANALHGTGSNLTSSSDVGGEIGMCSDFKSGSAQHITLKNEPKFDLTESVTMSAWFTVESWTAAFQYLVGKGDLPYQICRNMSNSTLWFVSSVNVAGTIWSEASEDKNVGDGGWHYATATFDKQFVRFYMDGVLAGDTARTSALLTDNNPATIGMRSSDNDRHWNGKIDEVRFEKRPRSADWIKLCHQNQRLTNGRDSLVWLGPVQTAGLVPAAKLTITTQPSSTATSGAAFAQQPVIQLRDASGNPVSQAGVAVTAAIASGGGTLAGTQVATTGASGTATFTNLRIDGSAGGRTISFSSSGLTAATSGTITVSAGAAAKLTITTQPSNSVSVGVAFPTQPVIQIRDAWDNPVSQAGAVVTAAIASGNGTLAGTLTAGTTAGGTATFTNLCINGAAGGHTISFSSGSLTGATSSTITVNLVAVVPAITVHPLAQTATEGQTATFSVTATGTAPLSYKWQKQPSGGAYADIPGATAASCTTGAVTSADNGASFRCVVSNSAGNVTSNPAVLTIIASVIAPAITVHPLAQTVTEGQPATFSVTATGTAPLKYQWQKQPSGGAYADIPGATAASCTTGAVTSADNGTSFRCVVSNSAGKETSKDAVLIVDLKRPDNPVTLTATAVSASAVELKWNSLAGLGIDSMRIYYDITEIPRTYEVTGHGTPEYVPVTATSTTVSGLNSQTKYFFGAQVHTSNLWSLITIPSSASVTTQKGDTTRIANKAAINTISFDTSTNTIYAAWSLPVRDSVANWAWTCSISPAEQQQPSKGYLYKGLNDTAKIDLGSSIVFDTVYYVWIWVKNESGSWSQPGTGGRKTIRTPSYSWQDVDYFPASVNTITAFNGNVILRKSSQWTDNTGSWQDRLYYIASPPTAAGLIPAGICFRFQKAAVSPSFYVGIKCNRIPPGYGIGDVRMYTLGNTGVWMNAGPAVIDSVNLVVSVPTSSLSEPFMLMVDSEKPQCVFESDTGTAVEAGKDLSIDYHIVDNIGNVKVACYYAKGSDRLIALPVQTAGGGKVTFTIPGAEVNIDNGVRAIMVVDDGRNEERINVSRRVLRPVSDPVSTGAMTWVPFRATGILDKKDADQYLSKVFSASNAAASGAQWTYDSTSFRLFRYYAYEGNAANPDKWVQYSEGVKDLFKAEPGRLLWIKTGTDRNFDLGTGTTPSLKDTAYVDVPPNGWADFALPYRFEVSLREMFRATGADSSTLVICKWEANEKGRYVTQPLWTPNIPGLTSEQVILDDGATDAYSVLSIGAAASRLKIPPVPANVTLGGGFTGKRAERTTGSGKWALKIAIAERDCGSLSSVICSYDASRHDTWSVPLAPSFSKIRAGILENGGLCGVSVRGKGNNDGAAWELAFVNPGEKGTEFRWSVNALCDATVLPKARIYNASDNTWSDVSVEQNVGVEARSEEIRWLAAGDEKFLESFSAGVVAMKTGIAGIYPNPLRSSCTIRFTIGNERLRELRFGIYDGMGRTVWTQSAVAINMMGTQSVFWDGKDMGGHKAGAGTYLVIMSAKDVKGKTVRYDRRVTLLP